MIETHPPTPGQGLTSPEGTNRNTDQVKSMGLTRRRGRRILLTGIGGALGLEGLHLASKVVAKAQLDCPTNLMSRGCAHFEVATIRHDLETWVEDTKQAGIQKTDTVAERAERALAREWSEEEVKAFGRSMYAEKPNFPIVAAAGVVLLRSYDKNAPQVQPNKGQLFENTRIGVRTTRRNFTVPGSGKNPNIVTQAIIKEGSHKKKVVLAHKTEPKQNYEFIGANSLIFEEIVINGANWDKLSPFAQEIFMAQQLLQPWATEMTVKNLYLTSQYQPLQNYELEVDNTILISQFMKANIQAIELSFIADGVSMALLAPDILNAIRLEKFTPADRPFIKRYEDMARYLLAKGAIKMEHQQYVWVPSQGRFEQDLLPLAKDWFYTQYKK